MSAHTPAPWRWQLFGKPYGDAQMKNFVGANGQGFAHTCGLSESEDAANANLIAAAPELLAALKAMVACCTDAEGAISPEPEDRGEWLDNMMAAHAAISKAEGGH